MLKNYWLTFLIKKIVCFIMRTCNLLETRIETSKKIHCLLEFNQSQWLKPYVKFNTKKIVTRMEKCRTS